MTIASLSQGIDPNSLSCNINVAGCSDEELGRLFISSLQPTCSPVAHEDDGAQCYLFMLLELRIIVWNFIYFKLASAMQSCNKVLYFWIIRTCDIIMFNIYA